MKSQARDGRKRKIGLICLLLIIFLAIPALPGQVEAFNGFEFEYSVTIPDANLHQELRKACNMMPYILDPRYPTNKMLAQLTGTLNLEGKGIQNLDGIQYCKNITQLNLAQNPVSSFPDMTNMTGLITLRLDSCQLSEIPAALATLPNLENLQAGNNKIKSLASLKGRQNIKYLDLYKNQISTIPTGLGLTGLVGINLDYNKCTTFPQGLLECKALEYIRLTDNGLKSIPDALGKMPNIDTLALDDNDLTSLPASLGSGKLKFLSVARNEISSVSDSLFKSKTIKHLDLEANNLTKLPDAIANSPYDLVYLSLNYLDISPGSKTLQLINKISVDDYLFYEPQLSPVKNLKATIEKDLIKLTWSPCLDVSGSFGITGFVSHYDVYLKENNKLTLQGAVQKSPAPTFIDMGLAPGTKREYSIAVIYEVDSSMGSKTSRFHTTLSAEIPPLETTTTTTEEPATSEVTTSQTPQVPNTTTGPTQSGTDQPNETDKVKAASYLKWIILGLALLLIAAALLFWFLVIRPRMKKEQ
ncbi:MAG: hypothetical protein WDA02_04145 [Saccharofermentanales bacterium]